MGPLREAPGFASSTLHHFCFRNLDSSRNSERLHQDTRTIWMSKMPTQCEVPHGFEDAHHQEIGKTSVGIHIEVHLLEERQKQVTRLQEKKRHCS